MAIAKTKTSRKKVSSKNTNEKNQLSYTDRLILIQRLFIQFGDECGFKVKVEKRHDYTTFSRNDLLEHLLWWYLVRNQDLKQNVVSKIWKTEERHQLREEIYQKSPAVKQYIDLLF